ncbi:DUF3592 domain-containing protein [Klebsiella aerogenes]|jgi:hypothetical protein|uniref:DUF3592 domain-containing protein n=2 Tax=Klebsiella aerogenes TaxID=548 RepID=A0AAW9DWE2_KLEAE|nr:DUF3592 domain-containing protein [Klebsiella aerogenes]MCL6718337.1 DUF3592 domain-containing protein [Klebsiella sp. T2.Ur]AMH07783.1 DUF3592 domain-containing protein [Klebsiella aerogenes]AML35297.1 Hypothetical protein EAG7_01551 [Klebsiella aerogenes]AMQ62175.1 DUF3592 domain-containing protein [Klebsiella aerogenes]ATY07841.1 DUF3592 domain-containing protein [Klebsiella aerogenes]
MDTLFFVVMGLIVLVFGIYPMARFLYQDVYPYLKDSFTHSEVLQSGIAVNADIIAAHQTSAWSGSKPIYRLTFKFKTREQVEVQASLNHTLNFSDIERFKPGNGTTIKYDPANPQRIALYDRPLFL